MLVHVHNSDRAVAAALPGWPRSLSRILSLANDRNTPTHPIPLPASVSLLQSTENILPFHGHEHNLWYKVLGFLVSCPDHRFLCNSPFSNTPSAKLGFLVKIWEGKGEIATAPFSQGEHADQKGAVLDQHMCRSQRGHRGLFLLPFPHPRFLSQTMVIQA